MNRAAPSVWYASFREVLRSSPVADQLRAAADGALLRPWTELLTGVVAEACRASGWVCAAKHTGDRPLPVPRDEYLGIDLLAFKSGSGWRPPVAAFELENSPRDALVAYALWKACMVDSSLAGVFCYRRSDDQVLALLRYLQDEVLRRAMPTPSVLLVVGTRAAAGTFPDGYFRPLTWDSKRGALSSISARASERRIASIDGGKS